MHLPYDLIYYIYFFVDDYITAGNFWYLCKDFNKKYMTYYNKSYKHKFFILTKNMFTFLSLLPELDQFVDQDFEFYNMVSSYNISKSDQYSLTKDTRFIYYAYKKFFFHYLSSGRFNRYISSVSRKLTNVLILQGYEFINRLVLIDFNKNRISIQPSSSDRLKMLYNIVSYYNRYNFDWLHSQICLLESSIG
jgi:hypothetical protein